MTLPPIYLASGSPRRRELLTQIAVDFEVLSVTVDESVLSDEAPLDYVNRIAINKAQAGLALVQTQTLPAKPVLAADTAVVLNDGQILGKPADQQQARQFLLQLSANSHQVITSVALATDFNIITRSQLSQVRFSKLSNNQIDWYLATGEGDDKAGAYAVQGLAAQFIEHIDGSYSGIMGLPLYETRLLLQDYKEPL